MTNLLSIKEVDFSQVKEFWELYLKTRNKSKARKLLKQPKSIKDVYRVLSRCPKTVNVISKKLKMSNEDCEKILNWLFHEKFIVLTSWDEYRIK